MNFLLSLNNTDRPGGWCTHTVHWPMLPKYCFIYKLHSYGNEEHKIFGIFRFISFASPDIQIECLTNSVKTVQVGKQKRTIESENLYFSQYDPKFILKIDSYEKPNSTARFRKVCTEKKLQTYYFQKCIINQC